MQRIESPKSWLLMPGNCCELPPWMLGLCIWLPAVPPELPEVPAEVSVVAVEVPVLPVPVEVSLDWARAIVSACGVAVVEPGGIEPPTS